MKKSKLLLGSSIALAACMLCAPVAPFAGEVQAAVNSSSQKAEYVYPDSFTVKFVQTNGKVVKEEVLRGYRGIFAPRLVMPNGEMATWKADCVDLVLNERDYVSAQTLDLDFLWTEKNPTIVLKPVVAPKAFNIKFMAGNKVMKETVLEGYRGLDIPNVPRVITEDGMANTWEADCIDLDIVKGDYVSAQTLDLDYLWTDEVPTIVFNAVCK